MATLVCPYQVIKDAMKQSLVMMPMPLTGSEMSSNSTNYNIVRYLAQGAYGACFAIRDLQTHVLYCAKVGPRAHQINRSVFLPLTPYSPEEMN